MRPRLREGPSSNPGNNAGRSESRCPPVLRDSRGLGLTAQLSKENSGSSESVLFELEHFSCYGEPPAGFAEPCQEL